MQFMSRVVRMLVMGAAVSGPRNMLSMLCGGAVTNQLKLTQANGVEGIMEAMRAYVLIVEDVIIVLRWGRGAGKPNESGPGKWCGSYCGSHASLGRAGHGAAVSASRYDPLGS
jgi:hypothetical protein